MYTRPKAGNNEVYARPTYLAPLYFPDPVRRGVVIGETDLALVLKYLTLGTKISNQPGPLYFRTLFAVIGESVLNKKNALLWFMAYVTRAELFFFYERGTCFFFFNKMRCSHYINLGCI